MDTRPARVDFWLDPGCPFTWRTSRWLERVAADQSLQIDWRLMSLAVLNDGKNIPPRFQTILARSWRPVRLLAAAQDHGGSAAVGRLYGALGRIVHDQGREFDQSTAEEALAAADLPSNLIDALDDARHDLAIRLSHAQGQARVGSESGSPVISLDG